MNEDENGRKLGTRLRAVRRIGCIGEAMVELSFAEPEAREAAVGVAGDVLNTAFYLARSAPEATRVAFVSALGADAFSGRLRAFLARHGLEDACATVPDATVGLYAITTDAAGERTFTYWRSASAARRMVAEGALDGLGAFDLVYLSGITLAVLLGDGRARLLDRLAAFREGGGLVAFDANYRPRLWASADEAREWIGRAWGLSDLALPSFDDERALWGDADPAATRARLRAAGVTEGAIKDGAAGALPVEDVSAPSFAPAARVVDTTAAGDSFNGSYLGARIGGADAATALGLAHDVACRVIGQRGAILEDI